MTLQRSSSYKLPHWPWTSGLPAFISCRHVPPCLLYIMTALAWNFVCKIHAFYYPSFTTTQSPPFELKSSGTAWALFLPQLLYKLRLLKSLPSLTIPVVFLCNHPSKNTEKGIWELAVQDWGPEFSSLLTDGKSQAAMATHACNPSSLARQPSLNREVWV